MNYAASTHADVVIPAEGADPDPPQSETLPVPAVDVDAILAKRRAYVGHLEAAAVCLRKAGEYGDGKLEVRSGGGRWGTKYFPEPEAVAHMVRNFDGAQWQHLLTASGLWTFLDTTAREAWTTHIREGTHPELNAENVRSTFAMLYEQRGEMFERGVVAIFRSLSWDYKTNLPVRFGKRLVITHALDPRGPYVSHTFCNKLDDLIRVMSVLDNSPEPDHRNGAWHNLHAGLNGKEWPTTTNNIVLPAPANGGPQCDGGRRCDVDTGAAGFFSLRGFKNGNCHLTFLRQTLVDEMNRILARHHPNALPPAQGLE
jgi:hypothetical protein